MSGERWKRFLWRPLGRLLPRNPWLRLVVIGIPVLLVLAVLEPVFRVFSGLFGLLGGLIGAVIEPLVATPMGRWTLLNLVLFAGLVAAWYGLRGRWRLMRSRLVLRRHLDATAAAVRGEWAIARDRFQAVLRSGGTTLPDGLPWLRESARLQLGRIALAEGRADEAVEHTMRVREKGLPRPLRRSLNQLSLRARHAQGALLPEQLMTRLEAEVAENPKDLALRRLLHEQLVLLGDLGALERAIEQQEAICRAVRKADVEASEQVDDVRRLFDDRMAAGRAALAEGRHDRAELHASRAARLDPSAPEAGCLTGDVHAARIPALLSADRHDAARAAARSATRAYGATRSSLGLDRVADLLTRHPGLVEPRVLLECCPMEGALIIAAREYGRLGDRRRALRTAWLAAERLDATPATVAALASVLRECGDPDGEQVSADAHEP